MRKSFAAVVLIASLLASGCVPLVIGAGAGAAGMTWYRGKLEDNLAVPIQKAHAAFMAGLKDLKIQVDEDKADNLVGHIVGRLASGDPVNIDFKSISSNTTQVTIRVGLFGNKEYAERILEAARAYL